VLLFVPTWQGLVFFFTQGAWALLALLAIVWIADIAAYFIGKMWGHFRHNPAKLAPSISPGKSWAGACGAVVAVLLYLGTYFMVGDTFFGVDLSGNKNQTVTLFGLFIFSLVITAVSIMGDLLESWFKRAANLKDSGTILPGHGGVYDRIDSMVAVVSVALGLYLLAFQ
jgi:phosphatidate cytidylyltransferase